MIVYAPPCDSSTESLEWVRKGIASLGTARRHQKSAKKRKWNMRILHCDQAPPHGVGDGVVVGGAPVLVVANVAHNFAL